MPKTNLGEALYYLLNDLSGTQSDLAEKANITAYYLSRLSNNPLLIPVKRDNREGLVRKIVDGLIELYKEKYPSESQEVIENYKEEIQSQIDIAIELDMKKRMPEFLRGKNPDIDNIEDGREAGLEETPISWPNKDGKRMNKNVPTDKFIEFLKSLDNE